MGISFSKSGDQLFLQVGNLEKVDINSIKEEDIKINKLGQRVVELGGQTIKVNELVKALLTNVENFQTHPSTNNSLGLKDYQILNQTIQSLAKKDSAGYRKLKENLSKISPFTSFIHTINSWAGGIQGHSTDLMLSKVGEKLSGITKTKIETLKAKIENDQISLTPEEYGSLNRTDSEKAKEVKKDSEQKIKDNYNQYLNLKTEIETYKLYNLNPEFSKVELQLKNSIENYIRCEQAKGGSQLSLNFPSLDVPVTAIFEGGSYSISYGEGTKKMAPLERAATLEVLKKFEDLLIGKLPTVDY